MKVGEFKYIGLRRAVCMEGFENDSESKLLGEKGFKRKRSKNDMGWRSWRNRIWNRVSICV